MSPATIDLAIRVAADVAKAETHLDGLGDAARHMADQIDDASRTAERAGGHLDAIGEKSDRTATQFSTLAGAAGDIGGGLDLVGLGKFQGTLESLATPLMLVAGLADVTTVALESLKLSTIKQTAATVASKTAAIAAGAAEKAQAAATWLLTAAMDANPIGLIIVAVVALTAGLVLLYKKSETFRKIVQAVGKAGKAAIGWIIDKIGSLIKWVGKSAPAAFNVLKRIAVAAFKAIPIVFLINHLNDVVRIVGKVLVGAWNTMKRVGKAAWDALTKPIRDLIGFVQGLIDKIKGIHWPSPPGWLSDLLHAGGGLLSKIGLARAVATPAAAPTTTAAAAGVHTTNINVTGAVDPVSTARQIQKLLAAQNRRIGIVTA